MKKDELSLKELDEVLAGSPTVEGREISKQKLEELYKLRDKAKELQKDLQSDELSLEELDEIKAGFRR